MSWQLIPDQSKPLTIHRLEDHSTITLRAKYGKDMKIVVGSRWRRFLGQMLPVSLAKKIGVRVMRQVAEGTNSVFFVVETQRTNTFSAFPRAMPFTFGSYIVVTDNVGNAVYMVPVARFMRTSNLFTEVFVAPIVSHLSTQLTARVGQGDYAPLTNRNMTFTLPNPAPQKSSVWNPGPLPLTNKVDDLSIVLRGFERDRVGSTAGLDIPGSTPRVEVFEKGAISTNWMLSAVSVEDEEGNSAGQLYAHLSPQEARKFRFEFRRVLSENPAEVMKLLQIRVRESGTYTFKPLTTNFGSHQIEVFALGTGRLGYQITPAMTDYVHEVELSYLDEHGVERRIRKDAMGTISGMNAGFSSSAPTNAEFLNLTFTFSGFTNRTTEFIARPTYSDGTR